mmetsp:Transcript_137517/g.383532  ORF Transcript_137517/g.383532 Transcript_137517/m.383532 type:complete len:248 (-) Transcript_137517:1754-2497(-)
MGCQASQGTLAVAQQEDSSCDFARQRLPVESRETLLADCCRAIAGRTPKLGCPGTACATGTALTIDWKSPKSSGSPSLGGGWNAGGAAAEGAETNSAKKSPPALSGQVDAVLPPASAVVWASSCGVPADSLAPEGGGGGARRPMPAVPILGRSWVRGGRDAIPFSLTVSFCPSFNEKSTAGAGAWAGALLPLCGLPHVVLKSLRVHLKSKDSLRSSNPIPMKACLCPLTTFRAKYLLESTTGSTNFS